MIVKTKIQIQYEIYPADKMLYRYLMNKVFVSYINPFFNTSFMMELIVLSREIIKIYNKILIISLLFIVGDLWEKLTLNG